MDETECSCFVENDEGDEHCMICGRTKEEHKDVDEE